MFADDAARALVLAAERADTSEPFNLGTGIETRIRNLAETIRDVVGYEGKTVWDTSRPDVRLHLRGIGRRAPGARSAE